MKRWSDELFRNRPKLSRATWRSRIDPLDTLRCASLFLVPSFGSPIASPKDEFEGLEALKHFLSYSHDKPYLAFRRAQAFVYAIDIAAKHDKLDDAWNLALNSIEGPNYLFPGCEAAFVLYPHFGPIFVQSCTPVAMEEGKNVISRMRELIESSETGSRAAIIPGLLEQHLSTRLEEAQKAPLPKMAPYAHVRELERVSRRAGHPIQLRDGADHTTISAAEKRIGYALPDEYKTLIRISNGWGGEPLLCLTCFLLG